MAKWSILIDHEVCFDCRACMVACMQENDLSTGSWINVVTIGPRKENGKILVDYVPVTCAHCAKPPCADVCPTGAITKREDGVVVINESQCIGCLACIPACPFSVIRLNEERGVAEKCNLCLSRIEKGLKPACVQHCQAGAILFGETNEVAKLMMERRMQRRIQHANHNEVVS